ncbi:Flp pilus assembly protein CpaB [Micrococcoides hystricis]|uniref:Flp pilus assembly protein CpaB n=1 Tax=Micrococcoides hystricis TaxID=1572761 RepID=A0ABV6P9Y8_9MICC
MGQLALFTRRGQRRSSTRQQRPVLNLTFREALGKHRRLFALVLALLAGFLTFQAGHREPVATQPVVVTAQDVPVGKKLSANDLTTVQLSSETAAALSGTVASPEDLIGEHVAVPLSAGMVLSHSLLLGPEMLAGLPAGTRAVTIRSQDATSAQILAPGATVDLIQAPSFEDGRDSTTVLAPAATILYNSAYHGQPAAESGPFTSSGASHQGEAVVVVAVPQKLAANVAAAASGGSILMTLSPTTPEEEDAGVGLP